MTAAAPAKHRSRLGQQWRDAIFLLVVLVGGSTLTLLAGSSLQKTEALRLKERITSVNQAVVSAFKLELTRTSEAIRGAGLMLEANPQLTREQFNRYMQKLVEGRLSVNLMEWQPIVPANQLAQFEAAARAAGLSDFRVLEPDPSGTGWQPVRGRDEYVPVLFGWPEKYHTEGLDMSFSPERMESKLKSRVTGQPVASGVFSIMKDGMVNSGTMAIAISTTVFAADQKARGYLAGLVDLPTLFQEATRLADAAKFDLLVFSAATPDAVPVYIWLGDDSDLKQVSTDLRLATTDDQSTTIDFAQQSWTLVLHPRPSFYAGLRSSGSLLAVLAGIVMTLLLLAISAVNLRLNARLRGEVSARVEAGKVLQRRQLMMERSESMARMASFEWDKQTDAATWSPQLFRILGRDQALGVPSMEELGRLVAPQSTQILMDALRRLNRDGTHFELEVITVQPDGEQRTCLVKGFSERDSSGQVSRLAGLVQDVTERKQAESEINSLAFYDPLTHLPNRRLWMDRLRQAIASSARHESYRALLFIDLDNFKSVNDTHGHAAGDQVLRQVAQRLSACLRDQDSLGRLGGDEFVVMLQRLSNDAAEAAAETELVAEKILAALNQPHELNSYLQLITPSIGVTLFGDYHGPIDVLLKQADLAMYRAKSTGRNTVCFFDQEMQTVVTQRVALECDLREAIAKEHFVLYFQAQMNDLGHLTGAEALLRWQHVERGSISPAEFIPLAEATGLILPLGYWVLKSACEQLVAWSACQDLAHLSIAVNVSSRQFMSPTFVDEVGALLDLTGANPQRLKLELTESLLVVDVEDIIVKMAALKARGVGFSMDDFGTGYSSLSYLKRLPLDQLKIDQIFVKNILTDSNDSAIAKMVIALAESMGLTVIAEGVETIAQQEFLFQLGCRFYQGYLFGPPIPIEQFEKFAERHCNR